MSWCRIITACSILGILSSVAQADEVQYGSIEGQVVYKGKHLELEPLVRAGTQAKDAEVCASADIPDERLIIDRESKGVINVFVWLDRKDDTRVHPDLTREPLNIPELKFQGCRIQPHALCVQTQTGMKVLSTDRIAHNPHDYPVRNSLGCLLLPALNAGADEVSFKQEFRSAELLPIAVKCDFHPWMSSHVLVQDHPYMTVTDAQGRYRLDKIPYGRLKLNVWHEMAGYLRKNYTFELNVAEKKIDDTELRIDDKAAATLRLSDN